MLKIIKVSALVLVGLGIATIAHAQEAGTGVVTSAASMPEVGAFEALSLGNQKIAEALFNNQTVTAGGSAPLSLDKIAATKKQNGWGRIFKQMKADGLTDAKNLGELVSGRYQRRIGGHSKITNRSGGTTVVTSASGRQSIIDKKSDKRQARHNSGHVKNRHGGKKARDTQLASHTEKPVYRHAYATGGSGSSYRGRMHNVSMSGHGRSAASLGISSGHGIGTSAIVSGNSGSSSRSGSNKGSK